MNIKDLMWCTLWIKQILDFSPNFPDAFLLSGDVTEKMIAQMVQMKQVVQLECAMKPNSAVMMAGTLCL